MGAFAGRRESPTVPAGLTETGPARSVRERLEVRAVGVVQGVGFRPFVYRLARDMGLAGWVRNDGDGVTIEAEARPEALARFLERLQEEKPPSAVLYALDHRFLAPAGLAGFEIRESVSGAPSRVWILPDLATCEACRREVDDADDRRYRYPFTNCTHCGPRFTIVEALPYDRPRTSMKRFRMCALCEREYGDPDDRRFHAQPDACPRCGPMVEFRSRDGGVRARGKEALSLAERAIRSGDILAVKGLGGYHLVADARNEIAVATLRSRKRREWKPFAVMYPDRSSLSAHVRVPPFAAPILSSPQAPILLLERTERGCREIAPSVAPGSPFLGVFLPYTPLHQVLLRGLGFPVVATSGNVSDEPIRYEEPSAIEGLRPLCDGFLTHDRPIVRPVDDSVLHIVTRPRPRPQMLRRARGYAPLPLLAPRELPPVLALGGHLNTVFALSRGREIILSQHIGDLETWEARRLYETALDDFLRLYDVRPELVVHDLHPDYHTTELALRFGAPRFAVQHHHAHLAACVLENGIEGPVLGITWDGTGYGPDGTVWGGEFLLGDAKSCRRVGSLRRFRLAGGERAVKEPWRVALSLLREAFGDDLPRDLPLFAAVPPGNIALTTALLEREVRSPVTTSMGRLFDGVSALLGISFENTHQAQSAQLLEYAAWEAGAPEAGRAALPLPLVPGEHVLELDWRELVRALVSSLRRGTPPVELAASFHAALARAAAGLALEVGAPRVALSGGVFANRYLTETILPLLEGAGFETAIHSRLPPTDGGLAAGQLWVAACRSAR